MGGGNSSPQSVQNDGINISGDYSGTSQTNYTNISSGPGSNTQSGTSTGATVGVKGDVSVAPVILLQNLNLWDTVKKDAEKVGEVAWKGATWCYSNA